MVPFRLHGRRLEVGKRFEDGGDRVEVVLLEVIVGDQPRGRGEPDSHPHLVAQRASVEVAAAAVASAGGPGS